MVNVWSREEIQRAMINQRFTCLIKGCLTQNKEEKKPRVEAEKLLISQTD